MLNNPGRFSLDIKQCPNVLRSGQLGPVHQLEGLGFTSDEIASHLNILFGHFELSSQAAPRHVPAVVSMEGLLSRNDFILFVRRYLECFFGTPDFLIQSFGIQGGKMEQFALGLVDNDTTRVIGKPTIVGGAHVTGEPGAYEERFDILVRHEGEMGAVGGVCGGVWGRGTR